MEKANVRIGLLFLLASCAIVALVVATVSASDGSKKDGGEKLVKVFDFDYFKKTFKRQYRSLSEHTARQKIFLARAFRAFISMISYKHKKTSSYLVINQFSDWTTKEKRQLALDPKQASFIQNLLDAAEDEDEETLPDAQTTTREHDDSTPGVGVEELSVELAKIQSQANVDSASNVIISELDSHADIIREPTNEQSQEFNTIESNNAHYEPPELKSSSSAEDVKMGADVTPLTDSEVEQINSSSGSDYMSSLLNAFSSALASSGNKKKQEEELRRLSELAEQNHEGKKHKREESHLPDIQKLDHRDCFSRVRDQGDCGSCYAFSTISIYEWHYCNQTGKKISFSEQYIVDCGRRAVEDGDLAGCDGGWPTKVSDFVQKFGLELRKNYPYTQKEDECPYEEDTASKSMGYLRVEDHGFKPVHLRFAENRELKDEPLLVVMAFFESFYDYGGGVTMGEDCDHDKLHAVVMVGSGRQDGLDYWLIRNSYSSAWGEKGYFKLYKYSGCIKPAYGYALRVKFGDEPKSNISYDRKTVKRHMRLRNDDKENDDGDHQEETKQLSGGRGKKSRTSR